MASNEDYALNEEVSFIQHFLPGIDAGQYQLKVQQQVLDSSGQAISGDAYSNTYTFAVTADRFAISQPGTTVSSVFPADNASGEYSNVLPHVVFNQKTFPWLRYPTNTIPYVPPASGTDTDSDVPTWLWVMLLDEDDVDNCAADGLTLDLTPVTRTVADLFPQSALPDGYTSSLGDNYSYFEGATDIAGLEPGQNLSDSIQTIDVPLSFIWEIAPTIADLRQMAHGREVSLINQTTTLGTEDPGEPTGTYAITFANRIPSNAKKSTAFLVSLEELEDFLPDSESGGAPSGNSYDGSKSLRLAVLYYWTFFSDGQPATFVDQLESLNGCTPGGEPASNTNIRIAYSGSNTVVKGVLDMGFVPLNETMRATNAVSGAANQTVSWYRGPLVPYSISELSISIPVASPDAAMSFDPTTGMLDVSYASAWSIGRLIALQDTSFSVPYYYWRRELEQLVQVTVEDDLIEASIGASLDLSPEEKKQTGAAADSATKGARSLLKRTILALNNTGAPDILPST